MELLVQGHTFMMMVIDCIRLQFHSKPGIQAKPGSLVRKKQVPVTLDWAICFLIICP